jgi:hypothetical protein
MGTNQAEIKPLLRIVGVRQVIRRIRVSAEYLGGADPVQKMRSFNAVFEIDD